MTNHHHWSRCKYFKSRVSYSRNITPSFIYRPPNVKVQIDSNIVSNLEGAILNSNETWLLGDVNVNLIETNSLPFLPQALSDIGLHQLISGVTHPASQACLDHVYYTKTSRIVASGILVYGSSNHLPVFAVRKQFIKPKRSHTVIQYRDYKHLNVNSFQEDLQQLPFNDIILESNDPVNTSLEKWYFLFNLVVNKHLPLRQKHVKRLCQPPWFSQQLLDAIQHRNKLLRKARRTKTDEDWRLYKISRNTTYYKIRSAKANFFKTAINDSVNNPRVYWDHLNTLIKGKNVQQHITLQVENNELTSDPNKVAKAFNLAFVNIAHKYIDASLQGTPDLQKLRSFVSRMKPSGKLFNIPPITSCFV